MKNMNEILDRKPVGQPSVPTLNFLIGDRSCNMNCKYCISKMTTKAVLAPGKWRGAKCRLAFSVAEKFNVRTVLLTGKGEPTLWMDDCEYVIGEANQRGFITELQTNGSLFHSEGRPKRLADAGLNTIAISRVAFDVEENNKICGGHSPNLEELIPRILKYGMNVRLSFLGMKGYNDTHRKIMETCVYANKLGVKEVTIRRMGMPDTRLVEFSQKALEIKDFVNENHVSGEDWEKVISSISQGIRTRGESDFVPYPILQVFDWGTVVWAIEGVSCAISDCLSIPGVQGSIRYLIYCPDGHMRYSWEFDQALIF